MLTINMGTFIAEVVIVAPFWTFVVLQGERTHQHVSTR